MRDEAFQLRHAPIVEAIADIDCDVPDAPLSQPPHDTLGSTLLDRYPEVIQHQFHTVNLTPDAQAGAQVRRGVDGYGYRTADHREIVQFRRHGFSFNRLAPYASFDDYLPEIMRMWRAYVELAKPLTIKTLRLRYVNRIELDVPNSGTVNLDEYFHIGPKQPRDTGMALFGAYSQVSLFDAQSNVRANLVLATAEFTRQRLVVVLDNAVDVTSSLPEPDDHAGVQQLFQTLRTTKNRVFRGALTDQCIQMFQSP